MGKQGCDSRPEWVEDLLDPDLTDAEYRMLVWFKRVQGKNPDSWYSLSTIAAEHSRSESTVKRTIKGLVGKGRLTVEHPENQHRTKEGEPKLTNRYTVVPREGVQKRTPSERNKGAKDEPLMADKGGTSEPLLQTEKGFKNAQRRGSKMACKYYDRGIPVKKEEREAGWAGFVVPSLDEAKEEIRQHPQRYPGLTPDDVEDYHRHYSGSHPPWHDAKGSPVTDWRQKLSDWDPTPGRRKRHTGGSDNGNGKQKPGRVDDASRYDNLIPAEREPAGSQRALQRT